MERKLARERLDGWMRLSVKQALGKSVIGRLLGRDAWYTVRELADATGLTRRPVMEQLAEMYDRGVVMLVMLPGLTRPGGVQSNSCRVLVHSAEDDRAVGEIVRLGDPFSAGRLSNGLYSSCMMKIVALIRKGELRTYTARDLAAEFVVMRRLDSMQMLDRRQRPDGGFLYSCSWRASLCNVLPTRLRGGGSCFRFSVKFEGGLPIKNVPAIEHANNRAKSLGGHPGCRITFMTAGNRNRAVIDIDEVAEASMDASTLEITKFPSKKDIISGTTRILWDAAEAAGEYSLFLLFCPLESKFRLLTEPKR